MIKIKLNTGIDAKDYSQMAQKSDFKQTNVIVKRVTDLMKQMHTKLEFIIKGQEIKMN